MTSETLSATTTVPAPADAVFAVLADPTRHAAIDGTGWVCESLDGKRLMESGQLFRMGMYHANHPDGRYEMANQVRELDPPSVISWEPGRRTPRGTSASAAGSGATTSRRLRTAAPRSD